MIVTPSLTSSPGENVDISPNPIPTHTSLPAIQKTPGVLDCSDILKAHRESTSEEWEKTKILWRGSEIYYSGNVYAVTETDVVHLSGALCHATLHHVPHDVAITLTKGQQIEGYGTIKNISYFLGEDVDVEVNPELLIVR